MGDRVDLGAEQPGREKSLFVLSFENGDGLLALRQLQWSHGDHSWAQVSIIISFTIRISDFRVEGQFYHGASGLWSRGFFRPSAVIEFCRPAETTCFITHKSTKHFVKINTFENTVGCNRPKRLKAVSKRSIAPYGMLKTCKHTTA